MKNIWGIILVLGLLFLIPAYIMADSLDKVEKQAANRMIMNIAFVEGSNEYYVNCQTPGIKMDAKAFIEKGRTYVPVRYLAYALGLSANDVTWDSNTKKITIRGKSTLELIIDKPEITIDGVTKSIDAAPVIKTDITPRCYLPARYVADGLGYDIAWDAENRMVICWPKDTSKPNFEYINSIIKNKPNPKQVALTFDDGPNSASTPLLLDVLKQNGVKATFFVTGSEAHKYPDLVRRMVKEGHDVGNHTWNHINLTTVTPENARQEITNTEKELDAILGSHSNLFRSPGGKVSESTKKILDEMGYKDVFWTVDPKDYLDTPAGDIVETVLHKTQPGGVILLHFGGASKNTIAALPDIVSELKEQGYTLVTVSQLLNIPSIPVTVK